MFYNHEKGGVDSHDQMCARYTTARKTSRWSMRDFYGIVDSSALNAFVIFIHDVPGFGGTGKTRLKFLKELSISLIPPQAKRRLVTPQTTQVLKQIICNCGILPEAPQLFKITPSIGIQRARDAFFVRDRTTKIQTHSK